MRIFSCTLLYLVSFCFYTSVFCQVKKNYWAGSYPEYTLRTSLTSWFDYDAGLMLGIGYRWSKSFSASFEPTWIFYNGFLTDEGSQNKFYPSGIKIRADLKYFPAKRRLKRFDFFLSPEFHYKQVGTKKYGTFGINCINGQCAFFQSAWYTQKKNEIGGLFKFGIIIPLLKVDQRWSLEFYGGLGFKYRRITEVDLPAGATPRVWQPGLWFSIDPEAAVPLIPGGLKLLFQLEKKD